MIASQSIFCDDYRNIGGIMSGELVKKEKTRVAIMASGSGSTAEAFINGTIDGTVDAEVALVISNNPNAGVFDRVDRFNSRGLRIGKRVYNRTTHPGDAPKGQQTREEAEAILRDLEVNGIVLVLLLGYMKKIVPPLVGGIPILNTHPGLLPDTAGLHGIHVQEFAIAQGHKTAGQTLHMVDEGYDTGKVLAKNIIPIRPDHTPETLFADVQVTEKKHIAKDVDVFLKSRLHL